MSKLTFRPRALDVGKSMPVFNSAELSDYSDYVAVNRANLQMPTGMEKEEESELHLQQAISAQQASSTGLQVAENVVIPTPKVVDCKGDVYDALYPPTYDRPKQFIKVQAALNLEPEVADYDLDSEDERWLARTKKLIDIDIDQMEGILDRLEKASEHQVAKLQEVKHLLQHMDDDVILAVYDYWLDKRHRHNATPLIPRVKTERRDGSTGVNPYIAFRRRAEKMQTRKNRKNDEDSYERILKLSQDLRKAVTLFDMIKRREKTKREIICMDMEILENRYRLEDWQNEIYKDIQSKHKPVFSFGSTKEEFLRNSLKRKREYRKQRKQHKPLAEDNVVDSGLASADWLLQKVEEWNRPASFPVCSFGNSDLIRKKLGLKPENRLDSEFSGRYSFRRSKGCVYYRPLPSTSATKNFVHAPTFSHDGVVDATVDGALARNDLSNQKHSRNTRTGVSGRSKWPWEDPRRHAYLKYSHLYLHSTRNKGLRYVGLSRCRRGRGGRLLFDRLSRDEDVNHGDFLSSMDEDNFLTFNAPECSNSSSLDSSLPIDRSGVSSPASVSIANTGFQNAPSHNRIMNFRPCSPVSTNELNEESVWDTTARSSSELGEKTERNLSGLGFSDSLSRLFPSCDEEKRIIPMAVIKEEDGTVKKCLPVHTGVSFGEYQWQCEQLRKKMESRKSRKVEGRNRIPDPMVTIEKKNTYSITTAVLPLQRVSQLVAQNQKSSPSPPTDDCERKFWNSKDILPPSIHIGNRTVVPIRNLVSNQNGTGGVQIDGIASSASDNRFYANHAAIWYSRSNGSRSTSSFSAQKRNKVPAPVNSNISGKYSPVESEMFDCQGISTAPSAAVLELNYPLPTPSPSPTSAKLIAARLGESGNEVTEISGLVPASGLIDSNSNKGVLSPMTSTVVPPIAISPPEDTPYYTANLRLRGPNNPHVTSNGEIEIKTTHPRHQQIARPVR